jgi:hypothetical protein
VADRVKVDYGLPWIQRRGLGNELFAWARCVVWCSDTKAKMFRAHWRQLHVGPYLRGERDKRQYHQLFRSGYGESWAKLVRLVAEGYRFRSEDEMHAIEPGSCSVFVFDGMRSCFHSLRNKHDVVLHNLESAAKAHVVSLPVLPSAHIGVHVRLSDFAPGTAEQLLRGEKNTRLPEGWYIAAIAQLRRAVGEQLPVYIYSDGRDDELAGLLNVPGSHRIPATNALSDILSLSRASAIIGSGSTFSAWASFLRQAPTICHRQQLHYPTRAGQTEIEWMPGERLGAKFVDEVGNRLVAVRRSSSSLLHGGDQPVRAIQP